MNPVYQWLVVRWNWPGAGAFCAVMLLILAPLVWVIGGSAIFWVFFQLPLYLLHQLEEHAGDRFRTFANATIGHGVEVLSRRATFVINSAGVWGVDLFALYLAVFVAPGWGLMALYLPLVNSLGHIGQAVAMKKYNPGLVTSILLFIPFAGFGLYSIANTTDVTWLMQVVGLLVALAVHAVVIVHVKLKLSASSTNSPTA